MSFIQIILATIVTLGLLVTIHEFGHFWVARRCGVKVLRFSVGFGRPLWRRVDKLGTEFVIAAIPLGGYVKMLDEREGPVAASETALAFNRKPVGQRIAIVVAGPAANFLFAIFAYWVFFINGVSTVVPVIGAVQPDSVAARAELRSGSEIISIDDVETRTWQAVHLQLLRYIGETGTLEMTIRPLDSLNEYRHQLPVERWLSDVEQPDPLTALGITPFSPPVPARIGRVVAGGAAEAAGLQPNDLVVTAEGQPISEWQELVDIIQPRPDEKIRLEVERDGQINGLIAVPAARKLDDGSVIGYLGVAAAAVEWPEEMRREIHYSLISAWLPALEKTWDMSVLTLVSLKKMVLGLISIKNLSGPITIAKVAGASVDQGFQAFLSFLAYLSISLGIINILPIPVLDGGHLMYYLVELVRGKPVSERVQMLGLRIGISMIIALMLLALYNDLARF